MAINNCKWAGEEVNSDGLVWCEKRKVYVTGMETDTCSDYQKK